MSTDRFPIRRWLRLVLALVATVPLAAQPEQAAEAEPPPVSARDRAIRNELRGPALERLQEALADHEWLATSARDAAAPTPDESLTRLALEILSRSPVFRPGPDLRGRMPAELAALRVLSRLEPGSGPIRNALNEATDPGRLYLLALLRLGDAGAGLTAVSLDPAQPVATIRPEARLISRAPAKVLFEEEIAGNALWRTVDAAFPPAAPAAEAP
ncbi:MAG: hypothetical protein ACFE0O_12770 [Opitutales bacterium]